MKGAKKRYHYYSIVVIIVITMLVSIMFTGCFRKNAESTDTENSKISVATTFYTMYDFTKKLGGDKVNIINLVPGGTEAHDWEPGPKDIRYLEKAKLLVSNGAGMEGWLDKVVASLSNKSLTLVETTKDIKLLEGSDDGHDEESENDPHVWLNPMNARIQLDAIKSGLIKVDPANASYYENNFKTYSQKLDELHTEYKTAVAGFKNKDIIVAHEAFGYLCEAYGLRQVAIEGLSSESEPTPAKMAEIIKFVRENKIKTIFFEELASPKVATAIAKETGAVTAVLNPLEGLTIKDIEAGRDYFSVMRDNLAALKKALE